MSGGGSVLGLLPVAGLPQPCDLVQRGVDCECHGEAFCDAGPFALQWWVGGGHSCKAARGCLCAGTLRQCRCSC